jgi:hypothetical protein
MVRILVQERRLQPGDPQASERVAPAALTTAYLLSAITAPLAIFAAWSGLAIPTLYHDPAVLVPQERGQDLVTLLVGTPLLVAALIVARRGSARGHLLWLGAVGYLAYTYTTYAFGAHFNALFLVYLALMGLSIYVLVLGLAATNARALAARFGPRAPTRLVGAFFVAVAGLMAFVWLADIVPAALTGSVPQAVREAETPTSVIHVLDLAVVLPALAITGSLLLRRAPWGYVLAGVLLVKAATLGLAILAMGLFLYLAGQPLALGLTAFFAVLTIVATVLGFVYLRALAAPQPASVSRPRHHARVA